MCLQPSFLSLHCIEVQPGEGRSALKNREHVACLGFFKFSTRFFISSCHHQSHHRHHLRHCRRQCDDDPTRRHSPQKSGWGYSGRTSAEAERGHHLDHLKQTGDKTQSV